jgi:hypothetical protein
MLLMCAAPSALAQTGRLIGWWKMDDATNASVLADSSGYGRNATKGSGVSIVDGRFGKAARFDGTGSAWASISTPALTNMTIAAWVYVDGIPTNILPRIMQIGADTYFLMPSNSPSQIGTLSLGVQSNAWGTGTSDIRFSTNKWFHTAAVYRQEYTNATDRVVSAVFYINGVRCGDPSGAKTAFKSVIPASAAFFGNNSAGTGSGVRPLNGMMDDVRLYNAPLSDRDIYALYLNRPLAVDAGKDLTCYRGEALLQGRLISTNTFMRDLSGSLAWSTVSAPEGATPAVQFPWLPTSPVTLPQAGIYTFRLTASNELGVASDDVTMVSSTDALPGGNAAPTVTPLWISTNTVLGAGAPLAATVTDDGKPTNVTRVCWSKVSGPGAVFFDNPFTNNTTAYFMTNGTYVVQLEADDGALTKATNVTVNVALPTGNLSGGLIHWWRMDDDPGLKKTFDSAGTNTLSFSNQAVLQPGKTGYGFRTPTYNAVAQGASVLTNAETMTFATWFYYDSSFTNNILMRLFFCGDNFRILYNRDGNYLDLATTYAGGPASNVVNWSFSNAKLATNRWFHIAVLFDRRAAATGSKQVMYLNGVKSLSNAFSFQYYAETNFPGAAAFTSPFLVGNNASGGGGTRNFDGVLDEMRVYNRFITDEEARLLATDPDNNHAPVIEGPTNLTAKVALPVSLQSTATDDAQPFGKTLSTAWSVVSGDASKVLFTDPTAPGTTATFTKTGNYVIMLSASDSELQAASLVRVNVVPTGTLITVY